MGGWFGHGRRRGLRAGCGASLAGRPRLPACDVPCLRRGRRGAGRRPVVNGSAGAARSAAAVGRRAQVKRARRAWARHGPGGGGDMDTKKVTGRAHPGWFKAAVEEGDKGGGRLPGRRPSGTRRRRQTTWRRVFGEICGCVCGCGKETNRNQGGVLSDTPQRQRPRGAKNCSRPYFESLAFGPGARPFSKKRS